MAILCVLGAVKLLIKPHQTQLSVSVNSVSKIENEIYQIDIKEFLLLPTKNPCIKYASHFAKNPETH